MAGLAPSNLRLDQPEPVYSSDDLEIEIAPDNDDAPDIDPSGKVISIKHGDGSVTVSLDGSNLGESDNDPPAGWFGNLVHKIGQNELGLIANDLLRGVDDDLQSRKEWIETHAQGIKLLGLTIELPNVAGASDGAPVEGMSKVRHPLLQEAVLRFQANARSELLPTDGPVKIRNDDPSASLPEDNMANALEMDMNHYLTVVAKEYYPDTDRMLLKLGFGGTMFKKVYFCPLRNRPVSETVDVDDLIVNNAATDLANAKRVTHKIMMRPSTVKRLQILGVYKDSNLGQAKAPELDSLQRVEKDQQGIAADSTNPEDRDREIYECYCELDISGFEHRYKGKISGLEIPYRVTIDVSSREILSIVRNYNDGDELPEARTTFVKYTFVPGFGFYDIGLLHILGNTTNAITAAWREMLDNGMYANFPGFLISKSGSRQNTNIIRVPPGGGQQIDTGLANIRDAVMPLPYNTQQMAPLMSLVEAMEQTGMRVGGTSEAQVGEGRADAPVGTTLAMIEQATKVLNAVHKRMHQAQGEEFGLIVDCFREHPESFWQRKCKSKTPWDEQTFLAALNNCEFVPVADPNTSSHAQRMAKISALAEVAKGAPQMVNLPAILETVISAIGFSNPQQFMASPQDMGKPTPEEMEKQAQLQIDSKKADSQIAVDQAKIAEMQKGGQTDTPVDVLEAQTRAKEVGLKAQGEEMKSQSEEADRANDRQIAMIDLTKEVVGRAADLHEAEMAIPEIKKKADE